MPDNPKAKPSPGRWKIAALLAALLVPCAVIGGNYMLQSRARQSTMSVQAQADAFNASLLLTPEQKEVRVESAKELRDKWRPWALGHQTELRRMLQADKSDIGTMVSLWNDIPATPLGDPSLKELAAAYKATQDPGNPRSFSWNPIQKIVGPDQIPNPTQEQREIYRKTIASQHFRQKREFDSFRDTVIANSHQSGTIGISLWASGRVTESQEVGTTVTAAGVGVGVLEHKELVPPFDFLTNPQETNSKETT